MIKTYRICPTTGSTAQSLQDEALVAFFDAREGDTIEFCEGDFVFNTGLFLHSKRGITIKGAGKDKTILNFDESGSSEGINVASSDGVVIQGLTVEDTPGNAIRIFRSNFVTLRRRAHALARCRSRLPPVTTTSPNNGAYGLYPVECRYVLIEDSESHRCIGCRHLCRPDLGRGRAQHARRVQRRRLRVREHLSRRVRRQRRHQ